MPVGSGGFEEYARGYQLDSSTRYFQRCLGINKTLETIRTEIEAKERSHGISSFELAKARGTSKSMDKKQPSLLEQQDHLVRRGCILIR